MTRWNPSKGRFEEEPASAAAVHRGRERWAHLSRELRAVNSSLSAYQELPEVGREAVNAVEGLRRKIEKLLDEVEND